MAYRDEFPDFDYDIPAIPGFTDESWHNDVCPSFSALGGKLTLWCDYADPTRRENEGGKRFTLVAGEYGVVDEQETLCETDDLDEALACAEYHRAQLQLIEDGKGFGNRA